MVYSVTIKHNRTDGSVYVHRLKEETTIDDFVCYRQTGRFHADDGARNCRDRDAALERGTRDIRQTWVGVHAMRQGLVGQSFSNGYGSTCAITVARMQEEMQKTVQKGYNVNESVLKSSVSVPSAPPVPVKLLIEDGCTI
jgi:hypothetical protein